MTAGAKSTSRENRERHRHRSCRNREVGSRVHRARHRHPAAAHQTVFPHRGARLGEHPAAGGALLVSNHSGGQFAADVPILAVEFYREVRLRPADPHAQPRHAVRRTDRRRAASHRLHPGESRERRRGAAFRPPRRGVPRRGVRRVPTHGVGERHRLRRPQGIRPDGDRGGGSDRARGVDRRTGKPAVPDARRRAWRSGSARSRARPAPRSSRSRSDSRSASASPE